MTDQHGAAPTPDPVAPTAPHADRAVLPKPAVAISSCYELEVDGDRWVAFVSGTGAYGSGHWGLAPVAAIHFARADAPDVPLLEALLGAGRLPHLFPTELMALFRAAKDIVKLEPGVAALQPRRFGLEG